MNRPAFESSLAALRDNVVMAIERREMGVVQDGLDVYQRLIETTLNEQASLQGTTDGHVGFSVTSGREWHRIIRDLHGVVDSVCASRSIMLWVDVLSWVKGVAAACADRNEINALGSVLSLFESAWSQELVAPNTDTADRQDALLLRLSEFGNFDLRRGRYSDREIAGTDLVYTRTFLRIVRRAIESGDAETTRVAIKYFLHGSSSTRLLNPATGAGLLALYAWILYRFDRGEQDESFVSVCGQIAEAFEWNQPILPILRASEELEHELGWEWWELRERGPMSSGVIQIGSYISLALLLVGGSRLAWETVDPRNDEDVDAARRLLRVIDSVEKGSFVGARTALDVPEGHFDRPKQHLREVVRQGDAILEEGYADLPVDEDRKERFRAAVQRALADQRSRSLAFALLTQGDPDSEEPQPNFGLDTLIPRWFFANTRVVADPESLADDLVRALVRGEEDRILDLAIGDLAAASDSTLEALLPNVTAAISSRELSRPVVITNSYQAHLFLTGRSTDIEEVPPEPFSDGPVLRVFDDRVPYVALLSPGIPTVRVETPAERLPGDQAFHDLSVIIGLSDPSSDALEEIVSREKRSRIDEARLRGSLRVRILEHLEVSKEADVDPAMWRLPDSTW